MKTDTLLLSDIDNYIINFENLSEYKQMELSTTVENIIFDNNSNNAITDDVKSQIFNNLFKYYPYITQIIISNIFLNKKELKYIFKNKHCEKLHLINNSINEIPDEIKNLKELKELEISNNNLTSFPESILKLNKLRELNLSYNHIREIPEEINKLNKLREFNISNNNLTRIPNSLINLPSISGLNAQNNTIDSILNLSIYKPKARIDFDLKSQNIGNKKLLFDKHFANKFHSKTMNYLSVSHNQANELDMKEEIVKNFETNLYTKPNGNEGNFKKLPNTILNKIFKYLKPNDLALLAKTNKTFRKLSQRGGKTHRIYKEK